MLHGFSSLFFLNGAPVGARWPGATYICHRQNAHLTLSASVTLRQLDRPDNVTLEHREDQDEGEQRYHCRGQDEVPGGPEAGLEVGYPGRQNVMRRVRHDERPKEIVPAENEGNNSGSNDDRAAKAGR